MAHKNTIRKIKKAVVSFDGNGERSVASSGRIILLARVCHQHADHRPLC